MASPRNPLQDGSFDPLASLRQARELGRSEREIVMLRVLWLRQRVPDARIETAMVSMTDGAVVMSATITLPDGGQGSGHSAASFDADTDPAESVELAETRAIGRAMDTLGYVVTDQMPPAVEDRPAPSPAPTVDTRPAPSPAPATERRSEPPEHVRALRQMKERDQAPQDATATQASPVGPYPEVQEAITEPPETRAEPAQPPERRPTPPERRPPAPAPTATGDADEPEMEDVSWTSFWKWARATYQLSSKGQLEELLGQPVGNKTPGQLRLLLIQHFAGERDES